MDVLAGCTAFHKLDLKQGDRQIPMWTAHINKMAIITSFGLFFEYIRMLVFETAARLSNVL